MTTVVIYIRLSVCVAALPFTWLYSSLFRIHRRLTTMAQLAQEIAMVEEAAKIGPGGVPAGAKTSDYYRIKEVPARFNEPGKCFSAGNPVFSNMLDIQVKAAVEQTQDELFQGYSTKPSHPVYRTSNSTYGSRSPSVHTMPTVFCAKSQKFTEELGKCGMFRNHSLNCASDKSNVPDH